VTGAEREGSYREQPAGVVGVAPGAAFANGEDMTADTASAGTTSAGTTSAGTTSAEDPKCKLEVRPHIWDLGGTMHATFTKKNDPGTEVKFIDSDQTLVVTVTVCLTGRIMYYLCDTYLCVNLAFQACGHGSTGDCCRTICLDGPNSPCNTNVWKFEFDMGPGTFDPGDCGREYELCITLGSKDCCEKVGFVFGSCHEYTITVSPPRQD
jgi:hypothetical protein